ncbi:MAG TPA: hypothetical protein VHE10_03565 [Candidatus Paceibacterota bacterium]|nr:hypothetical protein [Candidatus Paceibacterota bacterium]
MNTLKQTPKPVQIALICLIVIIVASLSYAARLQHRVAALENPNLVADAEIKGLVSKIGRYIVLPADETPTLATVSDPARLKDQPFFANAVVGDKVLIYTNSRKAILWRPSLDKIIEVSPLNVPPPASSGSK